MRVKWYKILSSGSFRSKIKLKFLCVQITMIIWIVELKLITRLVPFNLVIRQVNNKLLKIILKIQQTTEQQQKYIGFLLFEKISCIVLIVFLYIYTFRYASCIFYLYCINYVLYIYKTHIIKNKSFLFLLISSF